MTTVLIFPLSDSRRVSSCEHVSLRTLSMAVWLSVAAGSAQAGIFYDWVCNKGTHSWSTVDCWERQDGRVALPTPNSEAYIARPSTVEVDQAAVGRLELYSGVTLRQTHADASLAVTGTSQIFEGARFDLTRGNYSTGSLIVSDPLVSFFGATLNLSGGTANVTKNMTNHVGGIVLVSGGTLTAASVINAGDFRQSGGMLSAAITNTGRWTWAAGTSQVWGAFVNLAGGTLALQAGSVVSFRDGLTNEGTLRIDPGAQVSFAGGINLRGLMSLGGKLDVYNTGNVSDLFTMGGGTIDLDGVDSRLVNQGYMLATGRIQGAGTFNNTNYLEVGRGTLELALKGAAVNDGRFVVGSGSQLNLGHDSTGLMNNQSMQLDGSVGGAGLLLNHGVLTARGGVVSSRFKNTGVVLVQNGALTLSGASIENTGRIQLVDGAQLVLTKGLSPHQGEIRLDGGLLDAGEQSIVNGQWGRIAGLGTWRAASFINHGWMHWTRGRSEVWGSVRNQWGGSLTLGSGADVTFKDAVVSEGTLRIDPGAQVSFAGGINLRGLMSVGGKLDVYNTGNVSDLFTMGGGTIDLDGVDSRLVNQGYMLATGRIQGAGTFNNTNYLEVGRGTLELALKGAAVNDGRFVVGSGSQLNLGHDSTGLMNNQSMQLDGSVVGAGLLLNHGVLTARGGVVSSRFKNTGVVLVQNGALTLSGASIENTGRIQLVDGAQLVVDKAFINQGTLQMASGAQARMQGSVTGAGRYVGEGQLVFEAGFDPGDGPTTLTVEAAAAFGSGAWVSMELGGTTPGNCNTCADKLVFNRMVTLDEAELRVNWWGDYTGHAGDVFDLFDWLGGLKGSFAKMALPTLGSGLHWDSSQLYVDGTLRVQATAVPEPEAFALLLSGVGVCALRWRRGATKHTARTD